MLSRLSGLAAAACAVLACASDSTTAWQGSISDSAGVTIVQNPTQPLWRPDETWTLTEELRIGTAEGEPEYQFGQIPASPGVAALAVGSDGRIVVLDQQAQHLKVFGPQGAYERTIGGPGGGPGEIGPGVSAVVVSTGDTLLVSDIGNQRANLYTLDGTYVRSFPLSFADGIPFRWESSEDGRIVAQLRRIAFPGSTAPPDSMDVIAVRNLDGSVGDTLMLVPSGKTFSFASGAPEFNFFSAEPSWTLAGDRIAYGVNSEYRIGLYTTGGRLERVLLRPFERDPVASDDQDAIKDLLGTAWRDAGVPPQQIDQLMQGVHFAETYPAYAQIKATPDGTVWVQRLQAPSKLTPEEREGFNPVFDLGSREWDVFDEEGRYLGVVITPPRFMPVCMLGHAIYGVQRDELDVQYVVKLTIDGLGG